MADAPGRKLGSARESAWEYPHEIGINGGMMWRCSVSRELWVEQASELDSYADFRRK